MKTILLAACIVSAVFAGAQKVDSIYFHLYTDSLKKGVHNYINVDGKLADGGWLPLTSKQIRFSSSAGRFEGNDLILPPDYAAETVTVKAILLSDTAIWKELTIWIKKRPDDERLPSKEEVMKKKTSKPRRRH